MPVHPAAARDRLERRARALVERLGGRWQAGGATCRCPAHDDANPSLSIRVGDRGLLFKCFAGCAGIDVARAIHRLTMAPPCPGAPPSSARHADDGERSGRAVRLWGRARPVEGTPAERYLARRGLCAPHAEARYLARTPLGSGVEACFLPALLVAVRDGRGVTAIQRIFLDPVTGAQRDMPGPKRLLGRLRDGAVRLGQSGPVMGLAEGYETARAAMQILGLPVWATLGAARMPGIALPPEVSTVVLLADPDAAGQRAAARAAAAYRARGLRVEIRWPPAGAGDWAAVLAPEQRGRAGG